MHGYSEIDNFYQNRGVRLPVIQQGTGGQPRFDEIGVGRSEIQRRVVETDIQRALKAMRLLNDVIVTGSDTPQFEFVTLNAPPLTPPEGHHTRPPDYTDAVLRILPYSSKRGSSVSQSVDIAYRLAYEAAINPKTAIVGVAPPGSGWTSALTDEEQQYVKRTGRWTREDEGQVKPIPTIQKLVDALAFMKNVRVTRLAADSTASTIALAVGAGLPEKQISHAILTSHPQLTKRHPVLRALHMFFRERGLTYLQDTGSSPDRRQITPAVYLHSAIESRADIYLSGLNSPNGIYERLGNIVIDAFSSAHGNAPLLSDLAAFSQRQPSADVSLVAAEKDKQYSSRLDDAIKALLDSPAANQLHRLRIIKLLGATHAYAQSRPQFYAALMGRVLELPDYFDFRIAQNGSQLSTLS